MNGHHTLIVLVGPTGVGKTELSLLLAKLLPSPVVSADSRQMYCGLAIGTAAPTPQQLREVKHYFVHQLLLTDYYSAAQYEADVMALLPRLFQEHPSVLLTGGSMMYVDAVTKGIDDIPTIDPQTRADVRRDWERQGIETLLEELRSKDPDYYDIVDRCNHKRVIHAVEICRMTGKTFTSFRTGHSKTRPFRILKFGLKRSRDMLFQRINQRVDRMMADGLLDEARKVYPQRHLNSLNTVGYKEMFRYLSGEWDLNTAVERMKKNTRVYAKKQMTWFQKDPDIHWLDADALTSEQMAQIILHTLQT